MNSASSKFLGFLSGFIIGSIVGSTVAALSTPYNGEEAQSNLYEFCKLSLGRAKNMQNNTEKSIIDLKNLTEEKVQKIKQDLQSQLDNIVDRLDNLTAKGASVLIDDEIV